MKISALTRRYQITMLARKGWFIGEIAEHLHLSNSSISGYVKKYNIPIIKENSFEASNPLSPQPADANMEYNYG